MKHRDPLVSTSWLDENLEDDNIRILDASWRLPGTDEKNTHDAYCSRHIPGAQFFNIDTIADLISNLPHMCPSEEQFSAAMENMGISNYHHVIVYDDAGIFSAPRVWWTFRAMNHENVSVLDGGLIKWIIEDRLVTNIIPSFCDTTYRATLQSEFFTDHHAVRKAKKNGIAILDARPRDRFSGQAPEPRKGLRLGHIPDARSIPVSELITAEKTLKPIPALKRLFSDNGIKPNIPTITSCGSGITAAVINLALEKLGYPQKGLYDGAWAEWGDEGNDPFTFPIHSLTS